MYQERRSRIIVKSMLLILVIGGALLDLWLVSMLGRFQGLFQDLQVPLPGLLRFEAHVPRGYAGWFPVFIATIALLAQLLSSNEAGRTTVGVIPLALIAGESVLLILVYGQIMQDLSNLAHVI